MLDRLNGLADGGGALGRFAILLMRQPSEVQRKMIGVVLLELSVKLSGQFGFLVFVGASVFSLAIFRSRISSCNFFGRWVGFLFLGRPGLGLLEECVFGRGHGEGYE